MKRQKCYSIVLTALAVLLASVGSAYADGWGRHYHDTRIWMAIPSGLLFDRTGGSKRRQSHIRRRVG